MKSPVPFACAVLAAAFLGCTTTPTSTPGYSRPTVTPVRPLGPTTAARPTTQAQPPKQTFHNSKPKYPITDAKGKYTVRVCYYYPQGESTGVDLANEAAVALRGINEETYVTDLDGIRGVLSVGSFNDPDDPNLMATWQRIYETYYLKPRGGNVSDFQRQAQAFSGGKGQPFNDGPWPIEIEWLQMSQKHRNGQITEAQWQAYLQKRVSPVQ